MRCFFPVVSFRERERGDFKSSVANLHFNMLKTRSWTDVMKDASRRRRANFSLALRPTEVESEVNEAS